MKPDFYIHSSGLDNGGGGPALATPSKEEKQRTASKKEVSGKKKSKTLQKCVTLSFQIIARRFKVFASDLEKAVHYSIAHEVRSLFLLLIITGFLYL